MNDDIQLVDVIRTDKQLLAAILWRAWYCTKRCIARKVNL